VKTAFDDWFVLFCTTHQRHTLDLALPDCFCRLFQIITTQPGGVVADNLTTAVHLVDLEIPAVVKHHFSYPFITQILNQVAKERHCGIVRDNRAVAMSFFQLKSERGRIYMQALIFW
jgi:hypothetical protein